MTLSNAKFRRLNLRDNILPTALSLTTFSHTCSVFSACIENLFSACIENFQYFIKVFYKLELGRQCKHRFVENHLYLYIISIIYIYLVGGEEPGRVPALRYRPTVLPGGEDIRHAGTSDGTSPQSRARAFLDSPSLCALFLKAPCTSRYLRTSHSFSRHH